MRGWTHSITRKKKISSHVDGLTQHVNGFENRITQLETRLTQNLAIKFICLSATAAVANGGYYVWDTIESQSNPAFFQRDNGNQNIVVPETGMYEITFHVTFANASSNSQVRLYRSGADTQMHVIGYDNTGLQKSYSHSCILSANANQFFHLYYYGSQATVAGRQYSTFTVRKL